MTPRNPEADRELVVISHDLRRRVLKAAVDNTRAAHVAMEQTAKGVGLGSGLIGMFNSRIPAQEAVGAAATTAMSPEAQDALALVQDGTFLGDLRRDPTPDEIITSLDAIVTGYEDAPTAPVVSTDPPVSPTGLSEAKDRAEEARRQIQELTNNEFTIAA